MITFGSLFAGIGGLDLGLERAGMECVWQVEIDDYATKVLEKHWPNVRRWRDVTTFPPRSIEEWKCDLICGGFPCQDISYAGKGAGLNGARSGLWWEFARCIRQIRPRFVLVENVGALLVRGIDEVLGTLASLGYDAEWHCIPAAAVGAPHIRDRVFILGYCNSSPSNAFTTTSRPRDAACKSSGKSSVVADTTGSDDTQSRNTTRGAQTQSRNICWGNRRNRRWESEPDVGRVAYGVPNRLDRLRCLGNAVVPQVAEYVGRQILERFKE